MELWIRSQDRKDLVSTRSLSMTKGDYELIGIFANGINIGMYKTKERALEILDEIENLIKPRFLVSNISINEGKKLQNQIPYKNDMIQTMYDSKIEQINGSIVYQMPKE